MKLGCAAVVVVLALVLGGCGEKEKPKPKPPTPPPVTPAEPAKAPETSKPTPPPPTTPPSTPAPKSTGEVGKSTTSNLMYACPVEGCTAAFPSKGTCPKHTTTQMKEQWFVCSKCSVSKDAAGKCEKCGATLVRTLK